MREKILTYIERNSRVDLKDLAIMLGTDEAAVANEIADMEKEGVICGYHTLIDWDKAGIEKVTALIEVRVTPQRGMGFDKVAERIYNYPEVDCVYLISGGFDFMVMIEGKTMRGVAQYADNEIIPHLPTGKGIGAGIALALIMDGGKARLLKLRENPAVQMIGIMDEDRIIDIDRLYNAARMRVDGKKIPWDIPVIGELKFDVNDVDRLYKYIQEA